MEGEKLHNEQPLYLTLGQKCICIFWMIYGMYLSILYLD